MEWQVHPPGMWEDDQGPTEWWAVSNSIEIKAYFGDEPDAWDWARRKNLTTQDDKAAWLAAEMDRLRQRLANVEGSLAAYMVESDPQEKDAIIQRAAKALDMEIDE